MVNENKLMKVFLIVVNVGIWGYAVTKLIPLILGKDTPRRIVRVKKDHKKVNGNSSLSGKFKNNAKGAWVVKDPAVYFARSKDPFVPFLIPKSAEQKRKVVKKDVKRIVNYKIPKFRKKRKKRPVTVRYRLSSIVKFGDVTLALLVSGGRRRAMNTVNVEVGQKLVSGAIVKEINFKKQYVLIEKRGHVFKLVDRSPWISLIKKPK